MIGGRVLKVLEIMVCKSSWFERYYYSPLKTLKNINPNNEKKEVKINIANEKPITTITSSDRGLQTTGDYLSNDTNNPSSTKKFCCTCNDFCKCIECFCCCNCNTGCIVFWCLIFWSYLFLGIYALIMFCR